MHSGAQNVFLPNTDWVREAMGQVRPTLMCAVPRFYEDFQRGAGKSGARPLAASCVVPLGDRLRRAQIPAGARRQTVG